MTKSKPDATKRPLSDVKTAALLTIVLIATTACSDEGQAADETETIAGETYEEFDTRRDALDGSRGTFAGQGCTQDCSGHEAGYAWAEEKGITDPDNCGGKSWSFIEGCKAYAEQASEEEE